MITANFKYRQSAFFRVIAITLCATAISSALVLLLITRLQSYMGLDAWRVQDMQIYNKRLCSLNSELECPVLDDSAKKLSFETR